MFKHSNYTISKYLLLFLIISCSGPHNNTEATVLLRNNQTYIILKGKRHGMVHDPVAILKNKLYDDSLVIQIPQLKNGIVEGKDIPVEEGYYKYSGYISIEKPKLTVNLQIINTDDNKIQPETYNGEYTIVQK